MNYFINQYKYPTNTNICSISLPSSKSESNRLLVMNALSGNLFKLENLSAARDTQTLIQLLKKEQLLHEFNVLDAGTAMRFLTAYFAISTQKTIALTGTDRMQERPLGVLVEALNDLGASISFLRKSGYPPLKIAPFKQQLRSEISIPGSISSQYISALLMVAPTLPDGLKISIEKPIFSQPYIDMTLNLMRKAGIKCLQNDHIIHIESQKYQSIQHYVESDWSAASYWFSIIALGQIGQKVQLNGLKEQSLQGDQTIQLIAENLGVKTVYNQTGLELTKVASAKVKELSINFKECPDLAQTVMVCCAALKVNLKMTGLESLRIKETDRITALANELEHFNCQLTEPLSGSWFLNSLGFSFPTQVQIATYEDHRMAMSFAPLAILGGLSIEDSSVVKKSYPSFWDDLRKFGFELVN